MSILPDTALCAIVRDEIINPAGGIVRFIESIVPHVEEAVVVDGLSIDGTREALEEMQIEYPHLRVLDRRFTNYADQRNFSLSQVEAKRVLVLDADELLTRTDFEKLKEILEIQQHQFYYFTFLEITTEHPEGTLGKAHNVRLFEKEGVTYRPDRSGTGEFPYFNKEKIAWLDSSGVFVVKGISIKHFKQGINAQDLKKNSWYRSIVYWGKASEISPSQVKGNDIWKAYNPARDNFD